MRQLRPQGFLDLLSGAISLRGGQQITHQFEFDLGRHYFTGIALGAFQRAFEPGSKYRGSAYLADQSIRD